MEKPIIENEYLLQKFQGKGGWTYVHIPEILHPKKRSSGWLKVKGKIDSFEISNFSLAPMGNGKFFLPVKAEIRKRINKQAGDYVKIILFEDHSVFTIPEELLDCLKIDELAYEKFINLKQRYQKEFVNWIYAAKKEETKASRIISTIEKVIKDQNLYDNKEL